MKRAQPLLILAFVILIGFCGFIVIKGKQQKGGSQWYSSPTEPRDRTTYNKVMRPRPPNTNVWGTITNVTKKMILTNRLEIEYVEIAERQEMSYPVEKELMVPGKKVPLGSGRIWLDTIQVAYGPIPWSKARDYSVDVPWRVFTSDFKELSNEEIKKRWKYSHERKGDFRGFYPEVKWNFTVEGITTPKQLDFWVFDSRTFTQKTSGRSSSYTTNSFYFETELPMWHQGPLDIIMDLAFEPGEKVQIPFKEGSLYQSEVATLQLGYIVNGRSQSWGSNSEGKTNKLNITFVQDTNYVTTTVLFLCTPAASPLPLEIEFIGKNGKKLDNRGGGSSDRLLTTGYEGKPEDCESVLITPYKKVKRVILKMPEIPGLPETNRNIQNLFDVQIPNVWIRSEWELQNAIGALTQLRMGYVSATPPLGKFPMILTNVTPADLVQVYSTFTPTNTSMRVDQKKKEMVWEQTNPLSRFRRLLQLLVPKD